MKDLDTLEDMLRVALRGPASGCNAHKGDCPCRMIWLTEDLGYPTLNCEEMSAPMRKEDIRALCACKNAAPALIALVRAAGRIVNRVNAAAEVIPSLFDDGIMDDVAEFEALQEKGFLVLPRDSSTHTQDILDEVLARNKEL